MYVAILYKKSIGDQDRWGRVGHAAKSDQNTAWNRGVGLSPLLRGARVMFITWRGEHDSVEHSCVIVLCRFLTNHLKGS
jgi:hypothetical protein